MKRDAILVEPKPWAASVGAPIGFAPLRSEGSAP